MSLNLQETYVLLTAAGAAIPYRGGEPFFRLPDAELALVGEGWLVSEYVFAADWPSWEMHPQGDEFIYLLSGEAQLYIEYPDRVAVMALSAAGAVIVPQGMWHTANHHAVSHAASDTRRWHADASNIKSIVASVVRRQERM